MSEEHPLLGGNVTSGLVRVGDTVRRPAGPWTPAVHALLAHLENVGFPHSPRSYGLDGNGRHVVEYVPGEVAHPFAYLGQAPVAALRTIGAIIRRLHDALEDFAVPGDAQWHTPIAPDGRDLVVHNDLAPWNLVHSSDRLVFIDWDGAAPGTRMWDLSYAAHGFVPLTPAVSLPDAVAGLGALADGYRLDLAGRQALATMLARRTRSMYDLLAHGHAHGLQPWSRLWDEGHGRVWLNDAEWIEQHEDSLRRALVELDP